MTNSGATPLGRRRLRWLLALLGALGLAGALFHKPIQDAVLLRSLLMVDVPSESAFQELVERSHHPFAVLQRFWDTQKVPHRALTATYLKDNVRGHPELFRRAESLITSAAFDVDASVRELALATLAQEKHPDLPRVAISILRDVDPQLRLVALEYLRRLTPASALPAVFRALDDPDPRVVTGADSALRKWTQQDFGVRINQALFSPAGSPNPDPANLKRIQDGVRRWKEWWNKSEYALFPLPTLTESAPQQRLAVADFALKDLSGKTTRLSDFKGKVVLLNFWTTWCPGCVVEIPDLIELQKRNPENLVILGISLDGQAEVDEHGDAAGEHSEGGHAGNSGKAAEDNGLVAIRAKVEQFVKDKSISYRVLLDPTGRIGRRFNGGELPTNVLIDAQGFLRRRFLGGRSPAVSEAMIREVEAKTVAP